MQGSLCLAFAGLLAPAVLSQEPGGQLAVGKRVWEPLSSEDPRLLPEGPTRRLLLHSKSGGRVTIEAGSFDFDVYLRVETESGDVLGSDDDGGVETNARAVVELAPERSYPVLVASKSGRPGWFWVRCEPGDQPALSRAASAIAGGIWHGTTAGNALRRGDRPSAATHLELQASFLREQAKLDEAEEALDSARTLWKELGEEKRGTEATLELGRLAAARSRWADADARLAEALSAFRALPDPAGEARCLVAIAAARMAAGEPATAAARYEEALAVAEKVGEAEVGALALSGIASARAASGDRRGEREALGRLGDFWRGRHDFEKARELHRRDGEIARAIGDASAEAAAWSDLGLDWLLAREWAPARECFDNALRIASEIGDRRAQAEALGGLGRVRYGMQDFAKSLELHERQLEVAGDDGVAAIGANLGIGMCHLAMKDYPKARARLTAERERARAAGDRMAEADALANLSFVELHAGRLEAGWDYRQLSQELRRGIEEGEQRVRIEEAIEHLEGGETSKAQAAFERMLEETTSPADRWLRMEILARLGQCHELCGRHALASSLFSEMIDIARTLGRRVEEGEGLDRLGVQYRALGALDQASECLEEALSIARETGDLGREWNALNDLANAWLDLGDHEKALEGYRAVEALAGRIGQPVAQAHALNNMGVAWYVSERYEESRGALEQAVRSAAELRAQDPVLAEFRGNLARVLRKLGDRDRAKELAAASLRVLEVADSSDPRTSLIPLEALAGLAIDAGDAGEARAMLDRAAEVLEEIRLQAQETPGEISVNPWILRAPIDRLEQDLVRLQDARDGLRGDERARLLAEGFRSADRARARHLVRGIVEHRRGARSKEAVAAHEEWKRFQALLREKQREVSRAIRGGRSSEEVDRLRKEALELRTRSQETELALRAISPKDAALDLPEGADPDHVRGAAVTQDCAVIEYAEGDENLYAYVLSERGLVLLDLGERRVADAGVERYLELIRLPSGRALAAEIAKEGRELYVRLLAAPLEAAGRSITRIVVVPTPSLAVLPFDALVVSAEPDVRSFHDVEFVIESCEVDYVPSGSFLVGLSAAGVRQLEGKMLVLADPIYPSEDLDVEGSSPAILTAGSPPSKERASIDWKVFRRLQKTREEAFAIADALVEADETEALAQLSKLRRRRGGALHAKKIDLYLGSEATVAKLSGNLRPYKVLHLAGHGLVDGQLPQNTGVALTGTGTAEYQGFFRIAEAAGLDLDANLVVLSACDTARGRLRAGEGVESMASAFLLAGTRGVVASLWQVADPVAAETMKAFHAAVWLPAQGKPPAEALHEAKLALRRGSPTRGIRPEEALDGNEGNPYDWAPFVYIGRPR